LDDHFAMEPAAESISVRSMRISEVLSGPAIMATTALNKELLFDAIILLFDECNNEFMKSDPLITNFVNKCKYRRTGLKYIRERIVYLLRSLIGKLYLCCVYVQLFIDIILRL